MVHCPTCDAGLRFEVESQKMACDHCGNRFDMAQVPDSEKFDAKGHKLLDLYVFVCPDCGAELAVSDESDAVGFCPYCGGASMLFDRVRQSWVPDGIIPFKVTKEQCKQAYLEEVRRRPFVSRKYRNPEFVDAFRGIYMPYWAFEGRQQEPYKAKRHETLPGPRDDIEIERTYEQWYDIDYTITGLSHDASASFDDHTSELLAPYRDDGLEEFHPGYLSGFYAEIGDMEPDVYERYAVEKCQEFTAEKVPEGLSHDERRGIKTEISSLSSVLYPVWFMSYRRGSKHSQEGAKISYAAVNGQTCKVAVDLPISPLRVVIAAIAMTALIFGLLAAFFGGLPSIKPYDTLVLCAVISFASACFLNDSCLGTLEQVLKLDIRSTADDLIDSIVLMRRKPHTAAIMAIVAVVGTIFFVTDGSYRGSGRSLGAVLCLVSYLYYVSWAVGQMLYMHRSKPFLKPGDTSHLQNSVIEAFLRYKPFFIAANVAIFGACAVSACMGLAGVSDKLACYLSCFVMAIAILAFAAVQIAFQTAISERTPPQMHKRGAFYDEH